MEFCILHQNKNATLFCKGVVLLVKDKVDYDKPYWVTDIEHDYIFGCYKTRERATQIISEIYRSENGKYEMPCE